MRAHAAAQQSVSTDTQLSLHGLRLPAWVQMKFCNQGAQPVVGSFEAHAAL